MKTLIYLDKKFHAETIVKRSDGIIGYIGKSIVFEFIEIKDFQNYKIEDGDFDADVNELEQIKKENAELILKNAEIQINLEQQEKVQAELLFKVANLEGGM